MGRVAGTSKRWADIHHGSEYDIKTYLLDKSRSTSVNFVQTSGDGCIVLEFLLLFKGEQTTVWICVCPVSCRKETLKVGCHFAFLCSRAHVVVYCYAPDFAFLNLALALV